MVAFIGVLLGLALLVALLRHRQIARLRARRIDTWRFPASVSRKVKETYPHLDDAQVGMVMDGLRAFFAISLAAKGRMVAMPSKAVDVAWHEFIVCTRAYQEFCTSVLGRFLHHTPSEAMKTPTLAQEGIKRAWRLSCLHERMNPDQAVRLPLLFAIDQVLAIPDGYRYLLNCAAAAAAAGAGADGVVYCASDIGCSSGGCASGCGSSSGHDGGGDSGGDGGGCGGGGD
ncbi:MAG: hypothetical protein K0S46_2446 [Moraxellaceae bacterium]|jgi:hypothetical protein|nr:hypothetical protein [Moraxellaceae bacterium]